MRKAITLVLKYGVDVKEFSVIFNGETIFLQKASNTFFLIEMVLKAGINSKSIPSNRISNIDCCLVL